jgi:hypothetical protein
MEMSGLLSWANVSSSGSGCSEGYSGVACRDCIRPGYYRLGDACKPCPKAAYTTIIAVVFALCTWTFSKQVQSFGSCVHPIEQVIFSGNHDHEVVAVLWSPRRVAADLKLPLQCQTASAVRRLSCDPMLTLQV